MKKTFPLLIAIAVCCGVSVSMLRGSGTSSQVAGFQKLRLQPGRNFIGLNFKHPEGGGFDIQTLFDTASLTGSGTWASADQIRLWDVAAQEYTELWLFDSGGGNPDMDGKWIDRDTGEPASQTLSAGDGFWLIKIGAKVVEVVISGDVKAEASVLHAAREGYNVFASAWPVDKAINEMDIAGFTGGRTRGEADRIVLWDAQAQSYVELWLFDSGGAHPAFDGKWIDRTTGDVAGADRVIRAGSAAWLIKRTAGDLVETKAF